MGNILISQQTMERWKQESITADNLLNMTPYNIQEESVINSVKMEQRMKMFISLLLGISFSVSLRRYFPNTTLTENNGIYILSCISIVLPCLTICSIHTNQEVISKLTVIRNNHKILNS
jgi:hypothetical protein